jgi:hypothetical protein
MMWGLVVAMKKGDAVHVTAESTMAKKGPRMRRSLMLRADVITVCLA